MTGQLALPVRCYQTKGVPALRSPGFCESVLFEDDVVNSPLLEQVAGGQARLSATDHYDGEVLLGRLSNERFHDGLVVGTHGAGIGLDMENANSRIARIGASPFLDIGALRYGGAARKTKLCAHTLACHRE